MENENKIPQYDIHGALRIGRFTSGDSQAQYYVEETLYVTKEGNPFLCTKGDGGSRFAKRLQAGEFKKQLSNSGLVLRKDKQKKVCSRNRKY